MKMVKDLHRFFYLHASFAMLCVSRFETIRLNSNWYTNYMTFKHNLYSWERKSNTKITFFHSENKNTRKRTVLVVCCCCHFCSHASGSSNKWKTASTRAGDLKEKEVRNLSLNKSSRFWNKNEPETGFTRVCKICVTALWMDTIQQKPT